MRSEKINPFSLVRASDYTDSQINELWVELGDQLVKSIIEPDSINSKYILGGKGTGKTHLLRYYSYPVARLRLKDETGLDVLNTLGFLAVFLRTTALDAARFEAIDGVRANWQMLFGVYLELRLAENLLEAVWDIMQTSPNQTFDENSFLREVLKSLTSPAALECGSLQEFREWVASERRNLDTEVNNAAFSGELNITMPFAVGSLSLPIKSALDELHPKFAEVPLIYLLDEIENLSEYQQQVVNTLIRYGEGRATFRATGRLYARKTLATMNGGEENLPGSEFKVVFLDPILKEQKNYPKFAQNFITSRLRSEIEGKFDIRSLFCDIKSDNCFSEALAEMKISEPPIFVSSFMRSLGIPVTEPKKNPLYPIVESLTQNFPILLSKLNVLIFSKRYKHGGDPFSLAEDVAREAANYLDGQKTGSYATAYGHYKGDLFAQLCRESGLSTNVPYAGWDTFVDMSSGNPRSLLVVLGEAYSIAAFRELKFSPETPLPIDLQTVAAEDAAKFIFEQDTNYGSNSDLAKNAVARLGNLLRTARYSLNIPEVSPLAVSFSNESLTPEASSVLQFALNYSLVFEVSEGRADRNSDQLIRKIHLNPMLSPKWGLGTGRRGDLSLNEQLVNAIFDPSQKSEFESCLKALNAKWNNPFLSYSDETIQKKLF